MLDKFIEELEYNQKVNMEKGLENRVDIDYVIRRLKEVNVYWDVCKCEITSALEDVCNDELWKPFKKELDIIEKASLNHLTHKLYDCVDFSDIYECARSEIIEEIAVLRRGNE